MVFQATPEEYFRRFLPKSYVQPQQAVPYADPIPGQTTPPSLDPNVMIFCVTIVAIIAVVALVLYRDKR